MKGNDIGNDSSSESDSSKNQPQKGFSQIEIQEFAEHPLFLRFIVYFEFIHSSFFFFFSAVGFFNYLF